MGNATGIDPYIGLYFRDPHAPPADEEEFVASVAPGGFEGLEGVAAVDPRDAGRLGADEPAVAVRAGPAGQKGMAEAPGVQDVRSTARRARIPVLIQLRHESWDRDVLGLEKGSRLGRILTATADSAAIAKLADDPEVISVEASRGGGIADSVRSMPWIGVPLVRSAPYNESGAGVIVALIDGGIDVLHEAFRAAGGTSRILMLWDQRDASGPTPETVDPARYHGLRYGTLHSRADISRYIASGAVGKRLGRDTPHGHGTHVASIAAGSPFAGTVPAGGPAPPVQFPGGVAPDSDLVVVIPKLGADPGQPQSIGYSKTHVDALSFVRATADASGVPVVVNVSLGMNAGAHDGSSLLELAFDAFSGGGRDPGYVIVKSAGNEFGHDGHAYVQPFENGVVPIRWTTRAGARREDVLEFWFASCDDLSFTLVAPGGLTCTVDRAAPTGSADDPGGAYTVYLALTRFHADNGDSQLIVLVREKTGGAIRVAGDWRLEILGKRVFSGRGVHGWVEREDAARAVRFGTGSANDLTLSIPGTARTVISVGACEAADPLTLSGTSSRGPTRDQREKPELVAPGVDILAARAGTATGLVAMTGTSMAAPHVTGAIALLMARRARSGKPPLNAAQVRAALSQSLGSYNGRWQSGFGNGRLDVVKLLQSFE